MPLLIAVYQKAGDLQRRKISRANRKVRDRRENATRKDLRRLFGGISNKVLRRVEKIGKTGFTIDEIFRPAEYADDFNTVLIPHVARTLFAGITFEKEYVDSQGGSTAFARLVNGELEEEEQAIEPTDIEFPPSFTVPITPSMQREIAKILNERQVGVWKKVGVNTRNKLAAAVMKSIEEGEPFSVMQKRIKKALGRIKRVVPSAIARTETTVVMNAGGHIERAELQIAFKEWLSVIDRANRGMDPKSSYDHITPDGQIVKNSDPFRVSGEALTYPGDSSLGASGGNVVNCRCAAAASLRGPGGTRKVRPRPIPPKPPRKVKPKPEPAPPKPKVVGPTKPKVVGPEPAPTKPKVVGPTKPKVVGPEPRPTKPKVVGPEPRPIPPKPPRPTKPKVVGPEPAPTKPKVVGPKPAPTKPKVVPKPEPVGKAPPVPEPLPEEVLKVPQPKSITFTGKRTEFTDKIWAEIGEEGITSEEQARRVGDIIRVQLQKDIKKMEDAVSEAKAEWQLQKSRFESIKRTGDRAAVRKAGDAQIKAADKMRELQRAANKSRPELVQKRLSEVRDMGGRKGKRTYASGTAPDVAKFAETSEDLYPRDWVKTADLSDVKITLKETSTKNVDRAYYQAGDKFTYQQIGLTSVQKGMESVITHEFGHFFENRYLSKGKKILRDLATAFRDRRVKQAIGHKSKLTNIYAHQKKLGFHQPEVGWKDDFTEHYVGKQYDDGTTEIISMGIEGVLFRKYKLFEKDPDMVNFILGVLAGA